MSKTITAPFVSDDIALAKAFLTTLNHRVNKYIQAPSRAPQGECEAIVAGLFSLAAEVDRIEAGGCSPDHEALVFIKSALWNLIDAMRSTSAPGRVTRPSSRPTSGGLPVRSSGGTSQDLLEAAKWAKVGAQVMPRLAASSAGMAGSLSAALGTGAGSAAMGLASTATVVGPFLAAVAPALAVLGGASLASEALTGQDLLSNVQDLGDFAWEGASEVFSGIESGAEEVFSAAESFVSEVSSWFPW